MNSPYMGKFKVSQTYKPGQHDGLDLVGIDSKEVHATVAGTVTMPAGKTQTSRLRASANTSAFAERTGSSTTMGTSLSSA